MSNKQIVQDNTLDRIIQVFSKSILSIAKRKDIQVSVSDREYTPSIAWTDGTNIWLQKKYIQQLTDLIKKGCTPQEIAPLVYRVKGFLYHEAGHCMFTPRFDSNTQLIRAIRHDSALKRAFNILEDQRIESLLVAKYWGHKRFLTASTLDFVLKVGEKPDWQEVGHAFTHGRKFLPASLRKAAHDNFKHGSDAADAIADIIDEFKTLTFPSGDAKAIDLCIKFNEILNEAEQSTASGYGPGEQHHEVDEGHTVPESEQRIAPKPTQNDQGQDDSDDQEDQEDSDGESGDGEGSDSESDSESGEEASDDAGNGQGADSTDEDGDDDAGESSSGDSESEDDSSGDSESGHSAGSSFSDALDNAREKFKDLLNSDEAIEDAESFSKDLGSSLFRPKRLSKDCVPFTDLEVPVQYAGLPTKINTHLRQLTDKFRRGWKSNRNSGHLNAVAYRTRRSGETNFYDKFQRGQSDAAAVEVVVLLDGSGSTAAPLDFDKYKEWMDNENWLFDDPDSIGYGTLLDSIALAGWSVKRAIDSLPNSRCTVLAFGSRNGDKRYTTNGILYSPTERTDPNKFRVPAKHVGGAGRTWPWESLGSTNPEEVLIEGAKLFDGTRAENRLLVIVTDGEWDGGCKESSHAVIDAYNNAGVTTALFGVGTISKSKPDDKSSVVSSHGDHNCQYAVDLRDPLELPKKVQQLVTQLITGRKVTGATR